MKSTVFQLALVALFVAVASAAHIPGAETSKLSEGACDLCNSVVDNLMTLDLPEDVQVSKERCADIHDDFRQGCFELFENFDNADSLIAAEPSQACMHMGVCPLDDVSDTDTLVEDSSDAAPTESTAHDGDELMDEDSTEETGSSDPLASADPLVKSLDKDQDDDDEDESSDDNDNDDDDDDDDEDDTDVLASLSPNASPDAVTADTEPTALKLDEVEGMLELAPDNNDDDVLVSDDFDIANDDGTLASDKVVDQQLPSTQYAELAEEGQSSMGDNLISADDSEEAEVDDDAEEGDEDTAEAEDTTEGEDAEAEDSTEGEDAEAEDTTEGEDAESDEEGTGDEDQEDEEDDEGNVAHEINAAEPDASDDDDEDVLIGDFDSNIFTDNDSPAATLGHEPVQHDNELEQEMYRDSIAEEKETEGDVLVSTTPSFLSEDATETDAEEMDSDAEESDADDVNAAVDALLAQSPENEDEEEVFNFETA